MSGMAGINSETLGAMREKDGLSKTDMAKRLGISLSYYCDIERGSRRLKRNPGLVKKIAEVLNVSVSAIEDRRAL
jgi:transcriptional regulator with XRE-family HTH domain